MARAGFVYTPQQRNDDLVTCLYCDTSLSGWDAEDDPMYAPLSFDQLRVCSPKLLSSGRNIANEKNRVPSFLRLSPSLHLPIELDHNLSLQNPLQSRSLRPDPRQSLNTKIFFYQQRLMTEIPTTIQIHHSPQPPQRQLPKHHERGAQRESHPQRLREANVRDRK